MLAQWEGILAPEASTADATGESVWSAVSGQAAQFLADYAAWSAGGRDGLNATADELQSLRIELGARSDQLRAAGDTVGAAALADPIAQLDAARAQVRDAQDQADQWGGTWDTLAGWLSAIGASVGLGVLFVPIAISAAAAVAAIAALAYVLRTWRDAADRALYLRDLTNRVATGELSAVQAQQLANSYTPPSEGFFSGLVGGQNVALLLLGGLAVAAVLVLRR